MSRHPASLYGFIMQSNDEKRTQHAADKAAEKADRMAAALRENLRRRKTQARAAAAEPPVTDDPAG